MKGSVDLISSAGELAGVFEILSFVEERDAKSV